MSDYYSILPSDYYTALREVSDLLGVRCVCWPQAIKALKEQLMTGTDAKHSETIALDFDGVLHLYGQGWNGGIIYDNPVPGAVDACLVLMKMGFKLVVFTARTDLAAVKTWLNVHDFPLMDVTNTKVPAKFYVDDRAIHFTSWPQAMYDMARLGTQIGEP